MMPSVVGKHVLSVKHSERHGCYGVLVLEDLGHMAFQSQLMFLERVDHDFSHLLVRGLRLLAVRLHDLNDGLFSDCVDVNADFLCDLVDFSVYFHLN